MPFTVEQFTSVFRTYNESIWPAQFLLTLAGVAAVLLAWSGHERGRRAATTTLGALLIWCGVVYHWSHFTRINPAAWVFGALFIAGGAAFLAVRQPREMERPGTLRGAVGLFLAAYALLVYPLVGFLLGHRYPAAPTFGAPCPLTILALGVLIAAKRPFPIRLAAAPLLWSAVATVAAVELGMREDFGLTIAGVLALLFLLADRVPRRAAAPA